MKKEIKQMKETQQQILQQLAQHNQRIINNATEIINIKLSQERIQRMNTRLRNNTLRLSHRFQNLLEDNDYILTVVDGVLIHIGEDEEQYMIED